MTGSSTATTVCQQRTAWHLWTLIAGLALAVAQLGLPHDVVDPNQPEQRIDVVYPVLTELIAGDKGGS